MTASDAQLWGRFADEVLPWVGLPELPSRLRSVCPDLTRERIDFWVRRFTSTSIEIGETSDAVDVEWTDEEADGVWYDHMKRLAQDCIEEAVRVSGGRHTRSPSARQERYV